MNAKKGAAMGLAVVMGLRVLRLRIFLSCSSTLLTGPRLELA
jgi:hypothetical protein